MADSAVHVWARNAEETGREAAWLLRGQEKYPKLCAWVEENIEEPERSGDSLTRSVSPKRRAIALERRVPTVL
jgi:hypothetical protein